MLSPYFDTNYAIYLLVATIWTTAFSMTIRQPLRGCRNLGILACYVLLVVMLFRLRVAAALGTWCLFGIAGGAMYLAFELLLRWRTKDPANKPALSSATLLHGPLVWPVMIPEAIECLLAELGLLAPKTVHVPPFPTLHWDGSDWQGEITLQSWAGFQSRRGDYSSVSSDVPSDGNSELTVEPGDGRSGPPSPAQGSAFQFLLDNEPAVAASVLNSIFLEYPKMRSFHGLDAKETPEVMPVIERAEQLRPLIGLAGTHVLHAAKDGIVYIGFELGCTWDEEHGLGVITHRDRVVEVGPADTSFRSPACADV